MPDPRLDVITIGRSSVDLYGVQVGGRLEDMATFSKAVGGCPTNIAIGTARLGLKSGLITRVGDEHMGRFIREQCAREGVDVAGIRHRSGEAHLARPSRHPRRKDLPAYLLSRQLRRQRARRKRHRSGLYRKRQGGAGQRHAFLAPKHRRRPAEGDAHRARRRPQGRVRHRLSAQTYGGSPAMERAKSATSSRATSRRA